MRIALGIEFDGTHFCGWQLQAADPNIRTVQGCLESALSHVADQDVRVICAGRTDTGVHGLGQVVHFDTEVERSMYSWQFGANANLPSDICVKWAQPVSETFHARFSALRRRYRYIIFNRPVRPALMSTHMTWDYRPLDVRLMQAAARYLTGEHDFSSFRAYACQANSPRRTVYELDVRRSGQTVVIEVEANAFLHHMVRNIAGVLMTVGAGEKPPQWAEDVLEFRDRQLGGVTAPACGLYLFSVTYPEEFAIPQTEDMGLEL